MLCYLKIYKDDEKSCNTTPSITKNKHERLYNNKMYFVCKNIINNNSSNKFTEYKCKKHSDFYSALEYYNNKLKTTTTNETKLITSLFLPISKNNELNNDIYNFYEKDIYIWNGPTHPL